MKGIVFLAHEILGLFLDDSSLAVSIFVVVAIAAALAFETDVPSVIVGVWIGLGCVGALAISTLRGARG
jgi:hypothetical protein